MCEASKHSQYQLILLTGLFIFLHLTFSLAGRATCLPQACYSKTLAGICQVLLQEKFVFSVDAAILYVAIPLNVFFHARNTFYCSAASSKCLQFSYSSFLISELLEKYILQVLKTDGCCITKNIKFFTIQCLTDPTTSLILKQYPTHGHLQSRFSTSAAISILFFFLSTFLFVSAIRLCNVQSFLFTDYPGQFHCDRLTMSCLSAPLMWWKQL